MHDLLKVVSVLCLAIWEYFERKGQDSVKECSQKPSHSEIAKRFCSTVVEVQ